MHYNLEVLNKLSNIKEDKDIKALSHAIFPGTHCPLFGVSLIASYIEDIVMLVVGTSECTYYTKAFTSNRQEKKDKVYSLVLKDKDVVFGAQKKVREAVKYIKDLENPAAVMIVTTCVPELIGEDYEFIKDEIEEEFSIKILIVKTEHYKCNSHIPGMKRALLSLKDIMKKAETSDEINILGHRAKGIENTELYKLLKEKNIMINSIIPSKCKLKEIEEAPKARLNIVTDMIALDLAKEMERKFNIPYVFFDKHMDREVILEKYKKISSILDINLSKEIDELENKYNVALEKARGILKTKTFIYGNTPMMAFETSEFLISLGLEPKMIQVRELYSVDEVWKDKILEKGYDPYVTRIANIAPMRELYHKLNSDIYIGHENPMLLKSKGIQQVVLDKHAQKIGFELPIGIMKEIIEKLGED